MHFQLSSLRGFAGCFPYAWEQGRGIDALVLEKLDGAFVNEG